MHLKFKKEIKELISILLPHQFKNKVFISLIKKKIFTISKPKIKLKLKLKLIKIEIKMNG
mgnify:FL=1